jgi:hypothetical protein
VWWDISLRWSILNINGIIILNITYYLIRNCMSNVRWFVVKDGYFGGGSLTICPFSIAYDSDTGGRNFTPLFSTPFEGATLFSPPPAATLMILGGGFAGASLALNSSLIPKDQTRSGGVPIYFIYNPEMQTILHLQAG